MVLDLSIRSLLASFAAGTRKVNPLYVRHWECQCTKGQTVETPKTKIEECMRPDIMRDSKQIVILLIQLDISIRGKIRPWTWKDQADNYIDDRFLHAAERRRNSWCCDGRCPCMY